MFFESIKVIFNLLQDMDDSEPVAVTTRDEAEEDESSSALEIPDPNDPDLFDPECDPDNPKSIQFQDVSAASFLLHGGINRTPCEVNSHVDFAQFRWKMYHACFHF